MALRKRRAAGVLVVALVAVIGLAVAIDVVTGHRPVRFHADTCSVRGYDIDPDQASVAATMVGAVTSYRQPLPYRASVLVLMAALQESKLTNLAPGDGDRDSVGVLQQRPSQGWGHGKAQTLTDVGEATREFLQALVKVPSWQTLPPAVAIQDVQISADGSAYAPHEPEARALATALQGLTPAGITCSFAAPTLVAAPSRVAALARGDLGIDTPQPVGRTVRVPGAHWQTVAWFVANGDRLGIDSVAYDGRRWTRESGWGRAAGVPASAVVATMSDAPKASN